MNNALLLLLALPNTLRFNLHYFRLRDALRLPVIVSHRVVLKTLKGRVTLGKVKTGIVKIGFGDVALFDAARSRGIWSVRGEVSFKGKARIGHGNKFNVDGRLVIGHNVRMSAESAIVARTSVTIGDDSLISWDVLIMDSDFHPIYDAQGERINPDKPVAIGNRVWIGCRSLILKGVEIADGAIVAASTTLNRPMTTPNAILGGSPPEVIRDGIRWEH